MSLFQAIGALVNLVHDPELPSGVGYINTAGVQEVVLCSPTLAFIAYNHAFGSNNPVDPGFDGLFKVDAVNPLTGEHLATFRQEDFYTLTTGNYMSTGPYYATMLRLDDDTACFAFTYNEYVRDPESLSAVDLGYLYGTITTQGITSHRHSLQAVAVDHNKETGQGIWIEPAKRRGSVLYWRRYYPTFDARAIVFDFAAGTSSEFTVLANQNRTAPNDIFPVYYGTLQLADGRAYGALPDYRHTLRIYDNHNNVVDTITLNELGLDNSNFEMDDPWLYQLGDTADIICQVEVDGFGPDGQSLWYAQRYSTDGGTLTRIGTPVYMGFSGFDRGVTLDVASQLGINLIDAGNAFANGYRILNTPFFDYSNNAGPTSLYVGIQDVRNGVSKVGELKVPTAPPLIYYPDGTAHSGIPMPPLYADISAYASSLTIGGTLYVLYAFVWPAGYDPVRNQRIWEHLAYYQLWSYPGGGVPLRLNQRDDGNASDGAPRLAGPDGITGSSTSTDGPTRVGQVNTYD